MCGIAGFYGDFQSDLLEPMGQMLSHRGPDGHGSILLKHQSQRIGLAHRRLAIIDLSPAGHQPMKLETQKGVPEDKNSSIWITFNGEIYNFGELRSELEGKGHCFKSRSDTEVILHLYLEYGLKAFSKMNGIFALALYDGRESGQRDGIKPGDLLLFRDGLGVKPLYYTEVPQGFLFASEIKSLLCHPEVSRCLDLKSITYLLTYLYCPAPHSPFEKIKKVEPGQWLLIRKGRIHSKHYYYDVPYGQSLSGYSETEIALNLREMLENAARRQLISDVPVGAFLSGGLDSTSVVALMHQVSPEQRFQCFTMGYETQKENVKNDLYYAKRVAKKFQFPLEVVEVKPSDFQSLAQVIFHLDEPQADPAAINTMLISRKAREMGVKVLLSGAGGDDIFSGYPRHTAIGLEKLWSLFPEFLKKGVGKTAENLFSLQGGAALFKNDSMRKMAKVLESLQWDLDSRLSAYFMCQFPSSIRAVLGESFKDLKLPEATWEPFKKSLKRLSKDEALLNRMLYLETKHFLTDHNLNYVDKMSMSQGVEVRVPLIDREVVDFVAKIPASLKMRRGETKYIFKQAVKDLVPKEILNRKKQGFGLPIRKWLNTELREVLQDTLSHDSLKRRGLFDPKGVHDLMNRDSQGKIDATFVLFSLMSIEVWCREFLDKPQLTVQPKVCLA